MKEESKRGEEVEYKGTGLESSSMSLANLKSLNRKAVDCGSRKEAETMAGYEIAH